MSICRTCKEEKSLAEFYLVKGKPRVSCKVCHGSWYRANRDKTIERAKIRYQAKRGLIKKQARTRYERDREAVIAQSAEWRANNLDRFKTKVKERYAKNPGKYNAISALYRARKLQATPPWVDPTDLQFVYDIAGMFGMTVDHVIPLKHANACGLHVPWNLQLLPASENYKKRNKLDLDKVEWI